MTFQLAPVIIWASVEVNLVTISSMLPFSAIPSVRFTDSSLHSLSTNYSTSLPVPNDLHEPHLINRFRIQPVSP
jgi:hypothetical protein